MQTDPLFSIIVPCFNAGKYITKLLTSVLEQTFNDWELILIDDGSTDETSSICMRLQAVDKRVNYVYQKNAGVSNARNHGLSIALGKYVTFVDADDWIEKDFLESFKSNYLADINVCGYQEIFPSGEIREKKFVDKVLYSTQPLQTYTVRNSFFRTPWAVVFNRQFLAINELRFQERLSWGEDTMFMLQVVRKAKDINFIPNVLYNYRYTGAGLTNAPTRHGNMVQFLDAYTAVLPDVAKESKIAGVMIKELTLFLCVILLEEILKTNYNNKKKAYYINQIHRYIKILSVPFIFKTKVGRIRYLAAILAKFAIP